MCKYQTNDQLLTGKLRQSSSDHELCTTLSYNIGVLISLV